MDAPSSQYQQAPFPPSPSHPHFQASSLSHSPSQSDLPPVKQQISQSSQPPKAKPKNKTRTFSFRADNKLDLRETHAEKDARRLHSKADPTLAMNEAEPAVVAAMVATSIAPLRAIQHKDAFGNIIADPDKSNPTRNRWERPLDTIRSFEAAIEGDYARRSMYRSEMDASAKYGRRNSFARSSQPKFPQESYYGARSASVRGDEGSYGMTNTASARNSYYESQAYTYQYNHNDPGNQSSASGRYAANYGRAPSDYYSQGYGREQPRVYPLPHKDRSYETVTSAAASGSSEAAGYQTDPTSSDNSSIHRASPIRSPPNDYGTGSNQSQYSKSAAYLSPNLGHPRRNLMPNPPAPTHLSSPQVKTLRYEVPTAPQPQQQRRQPSQQPPSSQPQPTQQPQQRPETPEKRKSWLSRRFSRKSS